MDMCDKDPFRNGIDDVMFVVLATNYCKKRNENQNSSAADSCYNSSLYVSSLVENYINITRQIAFWGLAPAPAKEL